MKANGLIAAVALAAGLVFALPATAVATECGCAVESGVASFLTEENDAIASAAYDASFRLQEAIMGTGAAADQFTEGTDPGMLSRTATGTATAPLDQELAPRTLEVDGAHIPYIEFYEESTAPEHGAGLWLGSDDTTDGDWGYFIGHNPGDFAPVMHLAEGDVVSVCDADAKARDYVVIDIFDVDEGTYWSQIEERVSGYGESVVLQACCGDGAHYRVVVAA